MTTALVGYDQWGLLQIPTVTGAVFTPLAKQPGTTTSMWVQPAQIPIADPCIAVILDFLSVWLNTDAVATPAWQQINGAAASYMVKRILPHDPDEVAFEEKHLPALYCWREDSVHEWRGDDWLDDKCTLKMLWVYPLAQQNSQRIRQHFANAVGKLIDAGIERGRTPSWVQPNDPEFVQHPFAKTFGSLFWVFAGFSSLTFKSARPGKLRINDITDYPCIEILYELDENLVYGLERYPPLVPGVLNVDDGNTGRVIVTGVLPAGDPDMVIEFPVGNAAGTTQSQTVVGTASRLARIAVNVTQAFGAGAWLDVGNGTTSNVILNHTLAAQNVNLQAVGIYGFDLDISWNYPNPGLPIVATIGGTASATGACNIIVSGSATPGN